MYEINEDQDALEVIARLDERMNLEETDVNGKKTTIIHKGYASKHLFNIERFVQGIEAGWKGFVDEITRYGRVQKIRALFLGKRYYPCVNDWIGHYSDERYYSARVGVFYDACKQIGLIGQHMFAFREPHEIARADGARYMDAFNMLIEEISVRCQSREFKERERLRLVNAERNVKRVLAMEEAMFSPDIGRSRWLLLSLTLCIKPQYMRWTTPEKMQTYRERFFAARRSNKLMSGIRNYAWALEQGEKTGLHLHVMLFYSADHNHDEYLAKQIGDYWVDTVTKGRGYYWNSNAATAKQRYRSHGHGIGIGQIDWKNTSERLALRQNLIYLAKADQYLLCWSEKGMRTFGMGQMPEKKVSGRPRVDVSLDGRTASETDLALQDEDQPGISKNTPGR
jgi:hypothetical protein